MSVCDFKFKGSSTETRRQTKHRTLLQHHMAFFQVADLENHPFKFSNQLFHLTQPQPDLLSHRLLLQCLVVSRCGLFVCLIGAMSKLFQNAAWNADFVRAQVSKTCIMPSYVFVFFANANNMKETNPESPLALKGNDRILLCLFVWPLVSCHFHQLFDSHCHLQQHLPFHLCRAFSPFLRPRRPKPVARLPRHRHSWNPPVLMLMLFVVSCFFLLLLLLVVATLER